MSGREALAARVGQDPVTVSSRRTRSRKVISGLGSEAGRPPRPVGSV